MNENMKKELIEWGVIWDELNERFMGKEELIAKFMFKFLNDDSFNQLKENLQSRNAEEAFKACHALKGVSGNLSLGGMKKEVVDLTEILRANSLDGSDELFKTIEEKYNSLIAIIKKYAE